MGSIWDNFLESGGGGKDNSRRVESEGDSPQKHILLRRISICYFSVPGTIKSLLKVSDRNVRAEICKLIGICADSS